MAKIKVKMNSASQIIRAKGLDKNGDVQKFLINDVNKRITRYIPASSATRVLATKLKFIKSPTEIEIVAPYAKYQYYGKVMVGPLPKVATDKDLNYTKTFNQQAGPYWDRALMASEGAAITEDVQRYIGMKSLKNG